jgi:hypothetical protein
MEYSAGQTVGGDDFSTVARNHTARVASVSRTGEFTQAGTHFRCSPTKCAEMAG